MSQIQPVEMYCTQNSQAISLTKVSGFLVNQTDFINMQSVPCPDDTLKFWARLVNPPGRRSASYDAIRPIPPRTPPSIPTARFAHFDYYFLNYCLQVKEVFIPSE